MGKISVNISGKRFGSLTVIEVIGKNSHGSRIYKCECDCGNECSYPDYYLTNGTSTHCGCLTKKHLSEAKFKHGLIKHPLYGIWSGIKQRCYNPNTKLYPLYGGRGITMCDRWRYDFTAFISDMGERPEGTSLDRIDNDGPYSPDNCRWATDKQQHRNKKNNVVIEYGDEALAASEWAERIGVSRDTIYARIKRGWSIEAVVTTPADRSNAPSSRGELIEFDGQKLTQAGWANHLGIPDYVIYNRLHAGWSIEKTLTTPYKPLK